MNDTKNCPNCNGGFTYTELTYYSKLLLICCSCKYEGLL